MSPFVLLLCWLHAGFGCIRAAKSSSPLHGLPFYAALRKGKKASDMTWKRSLCGLAIENRRVQGPPLGCNSSPRLTAIAQPFYSTLTLTAMSSEAWNPDRIQQENLVLEPGAETAETAETGKIHRQKRSKAPIGRSLKHGFFVSTEATISNPRLR